ncbi:MULTISPECIES: glycosyltransferase family 2 protein [Niastella]|uniref:Glycosyltransferase family 2 protein n=1 Tax=Niastella soli TaxID=2821487 RepID=A0ABS3YSH6_9BACT|nr:glycosyltransferase family 2 protein [Niastella soli]MBO9200156.1 glycosyltransferase family 2 protein [Niastella soli]
MKISICIPQYNRIAFLLKNLDMISRQTYKDIEIVVSDDCSIDDTEEKITSLQKHYRYPLVYHRHKKNMGYDRNLRSSLELASGEYCFVLGNDDSLFDENVIERLVTFLEENNYPDVGFCNYAEDNNRQIVYARAQTTAVLGYGYLPALKHAGSFSFVAGLIYKRETFNKHNTDKYDGSIYTQMYLNCLIVAKGGRLFSINETLVLKDLVVEDVHRNSYRDVIAKTWKDFKLVDGGLPSVINVLIAAFKDAGVASQTIEYKIFKRIYSITFPHWILEYKNNKALPEAVGLIGGLYPYRNKNFKHLNWINRARILFIYIMSSCVGILTPVFIFKKMKSAVYKWLKK